MRRGVKITLAIILSIIVCFSSAIVVYADPVAVTSGDYIQNAGNMMNFFRNGSATSTLDISNISSEEMRTFGVLLSNFTVPFYTVPSEIDKSLSIGDNYNAWTTFCKQWGKNNTIEMSENSLLKSLLGKYKQQFTTDTMRPLFVDMYLASDYKNKKIVYDYKTMSVRGMTETKTVSAIIKNIMSVDILAEHYDDTGSCIKIGDVDYLNWFPVLYWIDDNDVKHTVLDLRAKVAKQLCIYIRSFEPDIQQLIRGEASDDNWGIEQGGTAKLYVSAFGDICYSTNGSYKILIPACLNPWAFEEYSKVDDVKFYMNNTFILGNFLTSKNSALYNAEFNGANIFKNNELDSNFNKFCFLHTLAGNRNASGLYNFLSTGYDTMVPFFGNSLDMELSNYSFMDSIVASSGIDYKKAYQSLWSIATLQYISNEGISAGAMSKYSNIIAITERADILKVLEKEAEAVKNKTAEEPYLYLNYDAIKNGGAVGTYPIADTDSAGNITDLYSRDAKPEKVTERVYSDYKKYLSILSRTNTTFGDLFFPSDEDGSTNKDNIPLLNDDVFNVSDDTFFGIGVGTYLISDAWKVPFSFIIGNTSGKSVDTSVKSVFDKYYNSSEDKRQFVTMWLGGQWKDDTTGTYVTSQLNSTTCLQIPIEKTVSNIGVFDTIGSAENGNAVKSISYLEYDNSNSVLKKFGSENLEATMLYLKNEPNNKSYEAYKLPECLYVLNGIDLTEDTFKLTDYGLNISANRNLFANIYWGYLEDICAIHINDNNTITNGTTKSFNWLPELNKQGLSSSLASSLAQFDVDDSQSEAVAQQKQAQILDWTYKILLGGEKNAGEAFSEVGDYVVNWLKSMTDSWFIGIHNKLVGIDMTSALTGTVANVGNASKSGVYSTAVGYITTPTFESLPITSWIVQNYQVVYIFLMLIVSVIVIFMVISKARRLREGAFVFIFMAFLLVLPMQLLDWGILVSNEVSEGMYNDKFMYWAVMQHAEAIYEFSKAENTIQANLQDNLSRSAENEKYGGVTVKWLSPKKWGITEKLQVSAKNANGLSIFIYLAGDMLDGETYTGDEDSTYLYRSYRAIWMEANNMYKNNISNKSANLTNGAGDLSKVSETIKKAWLTADSEATKQYGMSKLLFGKTADNKDYDTTYFMKSATMDIPNTALFRYTTDGDTLFRSALGGTWINKGNKLVGYPAGYYDSYYAGTKIMDVRHNTYSNNERIYQLYLDKTLTNTIATFNSKNVKWNKATENNACGLWLDIQEDEAGVQQFTPTSGVQTFLDYSESPYYYFYSVLKDTIVTTNTGSKIQGDKDFVSCLLSDDMFLVTDKNSLAYGMTKDYLDLEGLFTYIIPYLRYANQDVFDYKTQYTLEVSKKDYKDEEEYEKHKNQLQAIWNLYSPWVDALCTASGGSCQANSGFGVVDVNDQLNPSSYFKVGRPIAYSPAESVLRAYSEVDLTDVERKMQAVLTKTKEDMIDLLNYKDLTMINSETGVVDLQGNDILVSAAAMLATFHFNQEFSDVGLLHTNVQLYPLNFELENMNYDSYLRLIVGNSMGMNLKLQQNLTIYDNLIHNTSIITALILILVDIFGVFIIPVMKICLIVVIFIMAIALCVSCVLNKPEKFLSVILSTFVIPLCLMVLIFTSHAVVVSWFIGQGVSGVITSRDISITTGDPTITLILLLLVDIVTSFCMWLLLKFAFTSAIKYVKATAAGLLAVGQGTMKGVLGAITAVGAVGGAAAGTASLTAKGVGTLGKGAFGLGKAVMGGSRTSHQTSRNTKEMLKMMKSESGTGSGTTSAVPNQQQSQTLPKPTSRTVGKLGPTGGDNENGVKSEQSNNGVTDKKVDDKKGNAIQFSEVVKDMKSATDDLKNATQNLAGADKGVEKGTLSLKPKPMVSSGDNSNGVNDRPFEVVQQLFKPSVKGGAETAQDAYAREKAEKRGKKE